MNLRFDHCSKSDRKGAGTSAGKSESIHDLVPAGLVKVNNQGFYLFVYCTTYYCFILFFVKLLLPNLILVLFQSSDNFSIVEPNYSQIGKFHCVNKHNKSSHGAV